MKYSITFSKQESDINSTNALMEVITKVQALFGTTTSFTLEMGNFTSPEYGSYKMVFTDRDVYCCTAIWDKIFGECKIYQDEKDAGRGLEL
jgi:hypothetical protein